MDVHQNAALEAHDLSKSAMHHATRANGRAWELERVVDALKERLGRLEGRIEELEGASSRHEARLTKHAASHKAHRGRLEALEATAARRTAGDNEGGGTVAKAWDAARAATRRARESADPAALLAKAAQVIDDPVRYGMVEGHLQAGDLASANRMIDAAEAEADPSRLEARGGARGLLARAQRVCPDARGYGIVEEHVKAGRLEEARRILDRLEAEGPGETAGARGAARG